MARPILLYDGVCSLCDRAVQFVLRHDERGRFLFAPLQSDAAEPYLREAGLDAGYLESLVLVDEAGRVHVGADAALGVGRRLGPPWRAAARLSGLVPRPVRERVYRAVAQNRYSVFGTRDACNLPTPTQRASFLHLSEPAVDNHQGALADTL